jgi:hypothetical protein
LGFFEGRKTAKDHRTRLQGKEGAQLWEALAVVNALYNDGIYGRTWTFRRTWVWDGMGDTTWYFGEHDSTSSWADEQLQAED